VSFFINREHEGVYWWFPSRDHQWANTCLTAELKSHYPEHELCIFRVLDDYLHREKSSNGVRNLARAFMKDVQLIDASKTVFVYYDGEEGFSEGFIEFAEELSQHMGSSESKHLIVSGAIPTLYSKQCYAQIQSKALPVLFVNSWEATCSNFADVTMTVDKQAPKTKDFICFNRHPRIPRLLFLGLLKYYNLTSRGYITFNADGNADENFERCGAPPADLIYQLAQSGYVKEKLPDITKKAIAGWNKFPTPRMRIHHEDDEEFWQNVVGQDLSHTGNLGEWELDAYNDSHYAIIPETAYLQDWDEPLDGVSMPSHFITEKTWRHVALKMPLIVIGRPGILSAMRSLGYKTFHPYINEEYDEIDSDQDRMEAILTEIKRMSQFTDQQWTEWHENVDSITEYNYNILKSRGTVFEWHEDISDRFDIKFYSHGDDTETHNNTGRIFRETLQEQFPQARHITLITSLQVCSEDLDQDWELLGNEISQQCNLGRNDVVIVYDGDEGVTPNLLKILGNLMPYLGDDSTQFAYITGAFNSQRTLSAIRYELPQTTQGIRIFLKNSWEQSCSDNADESYTIRKDQPKQKDFMCFNKNMRDPRVLFLGLLKHYKLIDQGFVSQGPSIDDPVHETIEDWQGHLLTGPHSQYWNSMWDKRTLDDVVKGWLAVPISKIRLHSEDDEEFWSEQESVDFSHAKHIQDKELYEAVHYFVITETAYCTTNPAPDVVSADCHFLTEKTFRHIGLRMPFILLSRPGQLAELKNAGYQTFHPYIDETYDTLDNDQERMLAVVKEMQRLHTFDDTQWNEWHESVDKITEFNYNVLKSKTPELIEITEEIQ
jgi:hypothetical protein